MIADGIVQPLESFENGPDAVGRNPDARVTHHDGERYGGLVVLAAKSTDVNFALIGKFDGITEQIHQQLPETNRIANGGFGKASDRNSVLASGPWIRPWARIPP